MNSDLIRGLKDLGFIISTCKGKTCIVDRERWGSGIYANAYQGGKNAEVRKGMGLDSIDRKLISSKGSALKRKYNHGRLPGSKGKNVG